MRLWIYRWEYRVAYLGPIAAFGLFREYVRRQEALGVVQHMQWPLGPLQPAS